MPRAVCACGGGTGMTTRCERGVPRASPGREEFIRRCLWCSGFCTSGCESESGGSTPLRHPCLERRRTMIAKTLQRPALVLNRNWQPVNVATVARTLVLLWNEAARVVDPADFRLYAWDE